MKDIEHYEYKPSHFDFVRFVMDRCLSFENFQKGYQGYHPYFEDQPYQSPVSYTHLDVYKRQGKRYVKIAKQIEMNKRKLTILKLSLIHISRITPKDS